MCKELNDEVNTGDRASKAVAAHLMAMGASKMFGIETVENGKIKVTAEYLSSSSYDALLKKIDDINQVIVMSEKIRDDLYYELADKYREASGKFNHNSDCAIHNAPAYCPEPCNCDYPMED